MKEKFQKRRLAGTINITLSNKRKWSIDKPTLCGHIVRIIERYSKQGYKLSLRQLYYQLVAADIIPNDDATYKKLSGVLDDLRYSGLVDWDAIEDRGRVPFLPYHADGISDALDDILNVFRLDRQKNQPTRVECWTEKDAISGILRRVTSKYHVRLVVNKGYSSSSAMHGAYTRFADAITSGQKVCVLYFGDHDPSGLDMVRDIRERITFFLSNGRLQNNNEFWENHLLKWWDENDYNIYDVFDSGFAPDNLPELYEKEHDDFDDLFEAARLSMYLNETGMFTVKHIGLTMEQIQQYSPPPNPAKITDPRSAWYIKQFGGVSWEVDALPPDVMTEIVETEILANIDESVYESVLDDEIGMRAILKSVADEHRDKK